MTEIALRSWKRQFFWLRAQITLRSRRSMFGMHPTNPKRCAWHLHAASSVTDAHVPFDGAVLRSGAPSTPSVGE